MKKLKELTEFHNTFAETLNELDLKLQLTIKKIKKNYQNNLIEEKIKLLMKICDDLNINFDDMKDKYLSQKELSILNQDIVKNNTIDINSELLDEIEIEGNKYYYEQKDNGKIFNSQSKPVGNYINGKFILN